MAISNLVKGNGFKGALSYIMEKPEASHITQSGVFGRTPQEIALEMRMNANQREITDPVLHASLSLEPGEQATPEQLKVLGEVWLREMGFDLDRTQYTITRHADRDHDHIHILANRMQLDGKMLSTSNDFRRSHAATRVAEQAAGLKLFQDREKSQSRPRGKMHDLRQAVAQAVAVSGGKVDWFKGALAEHGIRLVEHRRESGDLYGVSFETADGQMFKGSQVGKAYTANGLKKAGLDIDRDGFRMPGIPQHQSSAARSERLDIDTEFNMMLAGDDDFKAELYYGDTPEWGDRLRKIIDRAREYSMQADPDDRLRAFENRLADFDVELKVYEGKGVGFVYEGRYTNGSALGQEYSGVTLQREGYDIGIDLAEWERQGRAWGPGWRSPEDRLSDDFKAMLARLGRESEAGGMGATMDDDVEKFIKFRAVKGLSQGQKDRLRKDRGHEM